MTDMERIESAISAGTSERLDLSLAAFVWTHQIIVDLIRQTWEANDYRPAIFLTGPLGRLERALYLHWCEQIITEHRGGP